MEERQEAYKNCEDCSEGQAGGAEVKSKAEQEAEGCEGCSEGQAGEAEVKSKAEQETEGCEGCSEGQAVRNRNDSGNRNYVYMVECRDGSLYTGWTNHLAERIRAHNEGKGAKYTRSRRPVRLVYSACFGTKEEAMRREWEIKHYNRKKKLQLIEAAADV